MSNDYPNDYPQNAPDYNAQASVPYQAPVTDQPPYDPAQAPYTGYGQQPYQAPAQQPYGSYGQAPQQPYGGYGQAPQQQPYSGYNQTPYNAPAQGGYYVPYQQNTYRPPVATESVGSSGKFATMGMIFSIINLALSWFPFVQIFTMIMGVVGIVFSAVGIKSRSAKAIVGLVLGILGVFLGLIFIGAYSDSGVY